jgi:hypothetical protein
MLAALNSARPSAPLCRRCHRNHQLQDSRVQTQARAGVVRGLCQLLQPVPHGSRDRSVQGRTEGLLNVKRDQGDGPAQEMKSFHQPTADLHYN